MSPSFGACHIIDSLTGR